MCLKKYLLSFSLLLNFASFAQDENQQSLLRALHHTPYAALTLNEINASNSNQSNHHLLKTLMQSPLFHQADDLFFSADTKNLLEQINQDFNLLKKRRSTFMDSELVEIILKSIAYENLPTKISSAQKEILAFINSYAPPFRPQEQHLKAIKKILSSKQAIITFEGVAGSGKTSSGLIYIVLSLIAAHHDVFISAPNPGGMVALLDDFKKLNKNHPLVTSFQDLLEGKAKEKSIIIIDEIFMTSLKDFATIIHHAVEKEWRLIFTGDSEQNLPATTSIIGLMDNLPLVHLFDSNRAGIEEHRKFARTLMQDSLHQALNLFQNQIKIHAKNENIIEEMTNESLALYPQVGLLIAPEADIDKLNERFHQKLISENWVKNSVSVIGNKQKVMEVGEGTKIIITKGNQEFIQGSIGTIEEIRFSKLTVRFGEAIKIIDTNQFFDYDYAYALTSPKSQGMSVPYAIVKVDKSMDQAALYVALTRHKKNLTIHLEAKDFSSKEQFINYSWINRNAEIKARLKKVMQTVLKL